MKHTGGLSYIDSVISLKSCEIVNEVRRRDIKTKVLLNRARLLMSEAVHNFRHQKDCGISEKRKAKISFHYLVRSRSELLLYIAERPFRQF